MKPTPKSTPTATTGDVKQYVQESMQALKQLRDEIRLEIHLGGMDVKDAWKKVEARFADLENATRHAGQASKELVAQIFKEYSNVRRQLNNSHPH